MTSHSCWLFARLALSFICLQIFLGFASAKHSSGFVAENGKDWVYVDRFCFDESNTEKIQANEAQVRAKWAYLELTLWVSDPGLQLWIYDDEKGKWPSVYHHDEMTCTDRAEHVTVRGIRPVANNARHTPVKYTPGNHTEFIPIHQVTRPRFWYFTFANCSANIPAAESRVYAKYDFTFINPPEFLGEKDRHFSQDEDGLLFTSIVFFIIFAGLISSQVLAIYTMKMRQAIHPVVILVTGTLVFQFFSLMFDLVHYATYAIDGEGFKSAEFFSGVFDTLGTSCFMLVTVLLAKGWTISTNVIGDTLYIKILGGIYVILALCAIIYQAAYGLDPTSLYVYESAPGILLLILRVVCLMWFSVELLRTYKGEHVEGKRMFYKIFGIVIGLWWISLPVVVAIGMSTIDPWVRHKTVTATYLSVNTVVFGTLVYMLNPKRAERFFRISPAELVDRGEGGKAGVYDPLEMSNL